MKSLVFKKSDVTLEMSASEKLSRLMDDMYEGQSTSSLKSSMRIVGLKGDSTAAFIKSILDTAMSGMSGSFSFKFPTQIGAAREEDLMKIAEAMHRETDYALTQAWEMLSLDDQRMGSVIAKQNAVRNAMLELCSTIADARAVVDNWLSVNNKLVIPNGAQLESTVIGGSRMYTQPKNLMGYKKKADETQVGSPDVWTKTSEIFGRKRVPLKGEASIKTAFELLADYAKSWEDFWSANALPVDADDLITKVVSWTGTLKHQGHVIETAMLSDAELIQCKKTAEEYYHQMINRRK